MIPNEIKKAKLRSFGLEAFNRTTKGMLRNRLKYPELYKESHNLLMKDSLAFNLSLYKLGSGIIEVSDFEKLIVQPL